MISWEFKDYKDVRTNLHWKIRMLLIVLKNIPDSLMDHGEERFQCPHASKVHDMFLLECKLQALYHKTVR